MDLPAPVRFVVPLRVPVKRELAGLRCSGQSVVERTGPDRQRVTEVRRVSSCRTLLPVVLRYDRDGRDRTHERRERHAENDCELVVTVGYHVRDCVLGPVDLSREVEVKVAAVVLDSPVGVYYVVDGQRMILVSDRVVELSVLDDLECPCQSVIGHGPPLSEVALDLQVQVVGQQRAHTVPYGNVLVRHRIQERTQCRNAQGRAANDELTSRVHGRYVANCAQASAVGQ